MPPGQNEEEEEEEPELLYEPPEGAEVWIIVKDRYGDYRGYISVEGASACCLRKITNSPAAKLNKKISRGTRTCAACSGLLHGRALTGLPARSFCVWSFSVCLRGWPGECFNNRDKLIGFINREDSTAGSKDEAYLGAVVEQLSGTECVVEDDMDERCGEIDLGTSSIKDNQGSAIAEIER